MTDIIFVNHNGVGSDANGVASYSKFGPSNSLLPPIAFITTISTTYIATTTAASFYFCVATPPPLPVNYPVTANALYVSFPPLRLGTMQPPHFSQPQSILENSIVSFWLDVPIALLSPQSKGRKRGNLDCFKTILRWKLGEENCKNDRRRRRRRRSSVILFYFSLHQYMFGKFTFGSIYHWKMCVTAWV